MPQQPLAPLPCKAQRSPERDSSSYHGTQSDLSASERPLRQNNSKNSRL